MCERLRRRLAENDGMNTTMMAPGIEEITIRFSEASVASRYAADAALQPLIVGCLLEGRAAMSAKSRRNLYI